MPGNYYTRNAWECPPCGEYEIRIMLSMARREKYLCSVGRSVDINGFRLNHRCNRRYLVRRELVVPCERQNCMPGNEPLEFKLTPRGRLMCRLWKIDMFKPEKSLVREDTQVADRPN